MKQRYRKNVFVSHIGLDAVLASAFKKWIEFAFPGKCDVFVSGDFTNIGPGTDWADKLREALTNSHLLLVICTSKSINSGWVLFEAGSIWGRNVPTIPICFEEQLELPVLLGQNQVLHFSEPKFSQILIKEIGAKLNLSAGKPAFPKMTEALKEAYESSGLDARILGRIKHVKLDRSLRVRECTAPKLAAHFTGVSIADMKDRVAALTQKGYLKRIENQLTGPYYSLTPKSERLLL
jgi:hypothetical protein